MNHPDDVCEGKPMCADSRCRAIRRVLGTMPVCAEEVKTMCRRAPGVELGCTCMQHKLKWRVCGIRKRGGRWTEDGQVRKGELEV